MHVNDEPKQLAWLQDWDRQVRPERQAGYVRTELERLHAAGEPVLYAALTAPLDDQRDVALAAARAIAPIVYLRLCDGAQPPPLDPQGRPVPKEHEGMLVAKTGQAGQMDAATLRTADETGEAARYGAGNRARIANTKQGLYHTVAIGRDPVPVPFDAAVAILRAWGHGVRNAEMRFRKRGIAVRVPRDKDNPQLGEVLVPVEVVQDTWIVEQVDPTRAAAAPPPERAAAPREPRSKAAAL